MFRLYQDDNADWWLVEHERWEEWLNFMNNVFYSDKWDGSMPNYATYVQSPSEVVIKEFVHYKDLED